jgi:hypothetical protein
MSDREAIPFPAERALIRLPEHRPGDEHPRGTGHIQPKTSIWSFPGTAKICSSQPSFPDDPRAQADAMEQLAKGVAVPIRGGPRCARSQ